MGIDKPDVRFVIHTALSKSIESYYQESGRAGRNGAIADCILYYNCADIHRIRKLIDNKNPDVHTTDLNNLSQIISFCENATDCRRQIQLEYFGEKFDRQQCISNRITACDSCSYKDMIIIFDTTEAAKEIIKATADINKKIGNKLTITLLIDIFQGRNQKKIKDLGLEKHALHGRGHAWDKYCIKRLIQQLILKKYLAEEMCTSTSYGYLYLTVGPNVNEFTDTEWLKLINI